MKKKRKKKKKPKLKMTQNHRLFFYNSRKFETSTWIKTQRDLKWSHKLSFMLNYNLIYIFQKKKKKLTY